MGLVHGERAKGATPIPDAGMAQELVPKEEAEIEEIVRPTEERVNPQRIFVARRRDNEWAVYEEDHSSKAIQKLQRTNGLVEQVKVT